MNHRGQGFPRRAFLRGAGAAIALPWFSSLLPRVAFGGDAPKVPPLRIAFLYVPNGADTPSFTPKEAGSEYALPFSLDSTQRFEIPAHRARKVFGASSRSARLRDRIGMPKSPRIWWRSWSKGMQVVAR